jgi:hypothetical protein
MKWGVLNADVLRRNTVNVEVLPYSTVKADVLKRSTVNTMCYDKALWRLMCYDKALWRQMCYDEALWMLMCYDKALWRLMCYDEALWRLMCYDEALWMLTCYDKALWRLMCYDEALWMLMCYNKALWRPMCYDEALWMLMCYVGRCLTTSTIWKAVTHTLKNAVTCCSDLRPDAVSLVNEEVLKNLFNTNERMNEWMNKWNNGRMNKLASNSVRATASCLAGIARADPPREASCRERKNFVKHSSLYQLHHQSCNGTSCINIGVQLYGNVFYRQKWQRVSLLHTKVWDLLLHHTPHEGAASSQNSVWLPQPCCWVSEAQPSHTAVNQVLL